MVIYYIELQKDTITSVKHSKNFGILFFPCVPRCLVCLIIFIIVLEIQKVYPGLLHSGLDQEARRWSRHVFAIKSSGKKNYMFFFFKKLDPVHRK